MRRLVQVLDQRQMDLTVLMERVHKPHNFSAILRSCDAAGVLEAHAVPPEEGLPLHRATASGAHKWVQVRRHETAHDAIGALREQGFRVLAAHPEARARDYREVDYCRPTAFLLGSELRGLTPESVEAADGVVQLPMRGMVQSFNVSVAAALLLFEAVRQRDQAEYEPSWHLDHAERARILFEWSYPRIAARLREAGRPYPPQDEAGALVDSASLDWLKGSGA